MKHPVALAIVATMMIAANASQAMAPKHTDRLSLVVETQDRTLVAFGTLRNFMRDLKMAGHDCVLYPYAYGVDISCDGTRVESQVYIGLVNAPTRAPDFLQAGSLRVHGRNGGELPPAEWAAFLGAFARVAGRPLG